jgi:hypothetical protein
MRRMVGIAAVLLATACGGGGDDGASEGAGETEVAEVTAATADDGSAEETTGEGADDVQTAEVDGARVRFVNLFREGGQGQDIDVWWGSESLNTGSPAFTVPYGAASDYVVPLNVGGSFGDPADAEYTYLFYTRAGGDPGSWLVTEDEPLQAGDQVTFFVGNTLDPGDPDHPGISNVFYEASEWAGGLPEADPASVLLFTNQSATSFGDGSDGDGAYVQLGVADGSGCLELTDEGPNGLLSVPAAIVEPGTEVADFGIDPSCTAAISEPVTLGDAGTRAVIYPFNDGTTRRLLLLDIAG